MVKQSISLALAGLIAFNFGSPVSLLAGSGDAAPAAVAATGALSLASDPLGAGVYVDGVFAGETPVSMNVPAGDHRVRFVKSGYLENSRIVSVGAERATSVQVRLTRNLSGETARPEQVQVAVGQAPSGGGRSMLPFLLAGVGGGFAAGYLYQKSKTEEAPANRPPTAGGVGVTPAIGLMGVTNVAFSVAGPSDPDGDPLTFSWSFGEPGAPAGTGANPSRTYGTAGTFNVGVTVSDSKGLTATTGGSVIIRSLTGTWVGTLTGNQVFNTTLTLTQTGTNISGTYSDQLGNSGVVETGSSVSAAGVITMSIKVGTNDPFVFSGTGSADLNTLTGTTNGSGFLNTTWVLTRQ